MKASTKRFASILGTLALIIASVAIYVVLLKPVYSGDIKDIKNPGVQQLRGEQKALGELKKQTEQTIKEFQNIKKQYESLEQLERFNLSLPDNEEIPTLINQLQNISQASGLKIENISLQKMPFKSSADKNVLQKPLGTLRINLQMNGSYDAIKSFLEGIETNLRLMDAQSLKLSKSQKGGFNYNISVDTYFQGQ